MIVEELREKVVYLCLILTSMFLSNQLLSDAADIGLGSVQQSINTYEELYRLNLPIFSSTRYDLYNGVESSLQRVLFKRTKFTASSYTISSCWDDQIFKNDRICIDYDRNIDIYSSYCLNEYGKALQTATFNLATDLVTQAFAKGSVFVEEFDKIYQRSIQAGFVRLLGKYRKSLAENHVINIYTEDMIASDSESLVIVLSTVVAFGFILSVLIFTGELLGNCMKKRMVQRQMTVSRRPRDIKL